MLHVVDWDHPNMDALTYPPLTAPTLFTLDDVGDATKADSVRGFQQLFMPGDVVEEAHRTGRVAWAE